MASEPAGPALQPLPKHSEPELPAPDAAARARLIALLARLNSTEANERGLALAQLTQQVDASWLPAALEHFERLASGANKLALKAELERIRARARAEIARELSARGRSEEVVTPEYLGMLVRHPSRGSAALNDLTEVVALSRIFERIGTLPAARALTNVYVRFGEFLRVDTQLALARLGDRAVAALVEARAHPVPRIGAWARRQLAALGRAEPSDAMSVVAPELRADILRAYGKSRDLDSTSLLLSHAASEDPQIRLSARQALSELGEAALWPLRDAYERSAGKRVPREWPWDRVARELFLEMDRVRLAEVYSLFNQGRSAAGAGDLPAARRAFDQVLARQPSFEHGAELAQFYVQLAEAEADRDRASALDALWRAERLAEGSALGARAKSLRYALEARALFERGLTDLVLAERALELDPNNARATALLAEITERQRRGIGVTRYLAAGSIGALSLLALARLLLRQRRPKDELDAPAA